jgi:curved DNA-binding protein CbpA
MPKASRFNNLKTYYQLLELGDKPTLEEIKKAYRSKAMSTHPDRNPSAEAAQQFVKINEAYEILSDPKKRAVYDDRLRSAREGKTQPQRTTRSGPKTQEEYEKWVRAAQARARQHAQMKYEEFRNTKYYKAEITAQKSMLYLVYSLGILMSILIMSFPTICMFSVNWKLVFLNLALVPAGYAFLKVSWEGMNGIKDHS